MAAATPGGEYAAGWLILSLYCVYASSAGALIYSCGAIAGYWQLRYSCGSNFCIAARECSLVYI